MKKLKRLLSGFLVIALMLGVIGIDKVYGETGNIGTGETGGTYGVGKDGLGYTKHKGGVRISCYFAEVTDADDLYKLGSTSMTEKEYRGFEAKYFTSDNVRQVGKTIHLLPDGASADVSMVSNQSVYDYTIKKAGYSAAIKGVHSSFLPYYTKSKSVVAKMPPVWDSSDADWKHWIMGSDLENPSYENIPELTELMGQSISAENFDKGIYIADNGETYYGFYKLFIEPEADVQVNKKHQYLTVRDIAAMGETSADTIATYISTVFTYIANGLFLIEDEPALVLPNGEYMTANEGPYLVRKQSQSDIAEIRKQMKPGGKIYSKMGVGVINPQLEGIKRNAGKGETYKIVKVFAFPYINTDGILNFKTLGVVESRVTAEQLKAMKNAQVEKDPQYGTVFLNDKIVTKSKLNPKTLQWKTYKMEDDKGAIDDKAITAITSHIGTLAYLIADTPNNIKDNVGVNIVLDNDLYTQGAQTIVDVINGDITTMEATVKLLNTLPNTSILSSYNILSHTINGISKAVSTYLNTTNLTIDKISPDANVTVTTQNILYLRYLVLDIPRQINLIQYYKDGQPTGSPTIYNIVDLDLELTDDIEFNTKKLKTLDNPKATLEKAGVCEGYETDTIKRVQDNLNGIDGLNINENVAVVWKIETTSASTSMNDDVVPQWRLSKYNAAEEFSQYATMKLKGFTTSRGCLAYKEELIPKGTISVDLLNPSGNVAGDSLEKTNNWLFVQAVKKGNLPSVSLNSKSASVNVDGNINVIKSESGIKLANWLHSNTVDSKYGITSATKSGNVIATTTKTASLNYGIKSKIKYSHLYGVYSHPATETIGYKTKEGTYTYDIIDADGNKKTVTVPYTYVEEYTYIDYPCKCYTKVEDVGIDYTKAQYKLSVALKDYAAVNNDKDVLKVADTKREENFKTTISKQNTRYLKVVPEVPMLFEDNAKKQTVVFAAGSQTRKISVVDYHTLEYKLDSLDAYSTNSSILNKNAKQTANRLGLGERPLIQKGANVNGVIEPKGELVVKSYALDVASSVKSTFGNSGYNSNKAHTDLISAFNTFKTGKADIALDIAAINGTSSIHNGVFNTTKNLQFKQKGGTTAVTHTLIVRGGVLQKVDGKEVSYIRMYNKELYDALVGMKLVGTKNNTVLKTLVSGKGDTLTESSFATLANSKRGTTDIKVGSGWYTEDTTVLEVKEYTTRFNIPTTQTTNRVPMKLTGLETPVNKSSFDMIGAKGYYDIHYTLTSTSLSSALGKVNVKMHYNTRTDNYEVGYGVSNTSIQDRTTGGF